LGRTNCTRLSLPLVLAEDVAGQQRKGPVARRVGRPGHRDLGHHIRGVLADLHRVQTLDDLELGFLDGVAGHGGGGQ